MDTVQTLLLDKKKFAVIPYRVYQSLIATVEDLQDLADIKKRKNEPRVAINAVKKKLQAKVSFLQYL